jgi:chemotaxis protein CheZ
MAPLSPEQTRERLGHITRQLHEAIVHMGLDAPLQAIADQIPDARERLAYVGQMTERAAHKVLGIVEKAQPGCQTLSERCHSAKAQAQAVLADPQADAASLRAALAECAQVVEDGHVFATAQNQALSDIMMTQDFQDLSGQVIQKVIHIISETETSLLALLVESSPEPRKTPAPAPTPSHPQLDGPQVPDKAMAQGEVDDLLASMGF